jgi:hypothetical protein
MAANGVDRRTVLKGLVSMSGAGLALIVPAIAEARPKMTKAKALYQDHPRDGQRCGGCKFFGYPSECSVVKGDVALNGWCRLYER